jgi:anti-sigma regulatory factor (Ser/Thr protein kinase)
MEMILPKSVVTAISGSDSSQAGQARRQAIALAYSLGFDDVRRGELAIVVTEAAANIAAHAGHGEVILIPWLFQQDAGIDVLALDKGQGIANVGRSMEDGYSTAGTAGQGLGAMSRLGAIFQLYSVPDQGTALFARVIRNSPTAESSVAGYSFGAVSLPIAGETECGDAWDANYTAGRSVYIVADGLGHGPLAAQASEEALRIFRDAPHLSPERMLGDMHRALTKTRGAAVSIAEVLHDKAIVNYAGVGNVAASIYCAGKSRSMVSMNGTLGHSLGRIQQFSYPWEANSSLFFHSDGITTRWNLDQYPGLASRHPALIAGILYRDFYRKRDDVTILVSRL